MGKVKQVWIDQEEYERIMNSVPFENNRDDDFYCAMEKAEYEMDLLERENIAMAEDGYDFYVRHNIRF